MSQDEKISRELTEFFDRVYVDNSQREARRKAINAICSGNTDEKIVELSGLSLSEVKELREQIIFAGATIVFKMLNVQRDNEL